MPKNETQKYAALKQNDVRYDGHFFVGVSSTRIYCRPICKAKRPKQENCTFYATAAEAEKAGYRPCLMCRPELAPCVVPAGSVGSLAYRAAKYMSKYCGSIQSVEEISHALGCSQEELESAFLTGYKVSLGDYLRTCRLHLAKILFTDTSLPEGEIARAVGFADEHTLETVFKTNYRLVPSRLRKKLTSFEADEVITLKLSYRPPYEWERILDFFAGRTILGVEVVKNGEYLRTVRIAQKNGKYLRGWIKVTNLSQRNALVVSVDQTLLPVLSQILFKVRHLFDLCCDPDSVFNALLPLKDLGPGLPILGIRMPGCFDVFEMAVRAVLGQQITVKAAGTLAGRFAETYGDEIQTGFSELTHTFPSPETIIALDGPIAEHLGPLGITTIRAKAILGLAKAIADRTVNFDFWTDPETEMKNLMKIPGIGIWTAQYIAMRVLGWPDAFPHTDYGVKKALAPRTPKEILALAENWRPLRGYAVINLWNSL